MRKIFKTWLWWKMDNFPKNAWLYFELVFIIQAFSEYKPSNVNIVTFFKKGAHYEKISTPYKEKFTRKLSLKK